MSKTVVVAMSTSGLDYYPFDHDIRILRLKVILGDKTYVDSPEFIDNDRFVSWVRENPDKLPKSSPPSRLEITKFFLGLQDEGFEDILFIAMSSALSKTYQQVIDMIPLLQNKVRVHVFNSRTGTFTEGLMALEADKCLKQGMSVEETLHRLEDMRRDSHVMFGVDDLTYMVKNGRLSFTSHFFANLFKIKPLINVDRDGKAVVAEKIMTTTRTMYAISDRIRAITATRDYYVFTLYSGNMELHKQLVDILAERNNLSGLPAYPISPVVTAHAGISGFGVGLLPL
ncbi:DegV family protein [Alysiella crassa]|uniref:DegV domain-containing protein SAV0749 n=1 Tax=Alysiella crassa TaxID=153491 RepID=A0A376BT97_9NEIS|nr:DegV family protein [Alysiella crassa]UOP07954.1 DegV family protein [Alysiella crassa]SSY80015.1 DegV domain-containing protein SAV0749 [Alysiella crassa]